MNFDDLAFEPRGLFGILQDEKQLGIHKLCVLQCDDGTYHGYVLLDRDSVKCGNLRTFERGGMNPKEVTEWMQEAEEIFT